MKQAGAASKGRREQVLLAVLNATVLGVVLLIAPGLVLFYDITPKIVMLLCGTAATLLLFPAWLGGLKLLWRESLGRVFLGLIAVHLVSLLVSTLLSPQPGLSFAGSNWRRLGLVTHGATMLFVVASAAYFTAQRARLGTLLRVFAIGGMASAVYGILQYSGIDPFVPAESYHFGEGEWTIVRTPGTLGHAGYFATYLLTAVFWALALARNESSRAWSRLALAAAALGVFAIVLSGTRGALLGLAAGGIMALVWRGPRIDRRVLAGALLATITLAAFYYSPWGEKLRGRARWSIEDASGGGRLMLWRDSLRMFAAGSWLHGAGLETYSAEFPVFLSPELAKAYPNRYYESPHNIFLDALTAQGLPGLLFLLGMTAIAVVAAWRLKKLGAPTGAWFAAAFAAALGSGQFLAFTVPTALCFYLSVAVLVVASVAQTKTEATPQTPRWGYFAAAPAAILMAVFAVQLAAADALLARTRQYAAAEIGAAIQEYEQAQRLSPWGMNFDLWFSRWMMEAAQRTAPSTEQSRAWQAATNAGERAAERAAERQSARYNLAVLYGLQNDAQRAEAALRRTIEAAPAWYKPRWMLAQLLRQTGRSDEARREAEIAHELNGGENEEVTETWNQLRQTRRTMSQ
ncbi:MAG: O-antigen ligase family protein [Bryobacterales bacterium]